MADQIYLVKEKKVNDWRIIDEQENYWKEKSFLKINFPQFWQQALETKNRFYQYVISETQRYIELTKQEEKNIKEDHCELFWHRHCDFCTKSMTVDLNEPCYCSKNGVDWICSECFNDFRQRFEWKVLDPVEDIPLKGFIPLQVTKA